MKYQEGQIGKKELTDDPSLRKDSFLSLHPATSLSLSQTIKGLFELTWRPSRALDSPCALLPKLQRYKDTVRCITLCRREGPRTLPRTTDANLNCVFVGNKLVFVIWKMGRPGPPLPPPPCDPQCVHAV